MDRFKPTNKKPLSTASKKMEKNFNNGIKKSGLDLTEVDSMLSEKEQSFKKKFWDLPKMESLVHSDPILSAEYQEMSEDGQEKYGYHYNETIMNMLFNKYVTHDQGYQQKYLNAIPAKKERRDKSGIHQLQQKGEEKMKAKETPAPKAEGDVPIHNNSLEGVIEENPMDNNLNSDGGGNFDDREYLDKRIEKNYDTMKEADHETIRQANARAINDYEKNKSKPLHVDDFEKTEKQYDTVDFIDNNAGAGVKKDAVNKGYIEDPYNGNAYFEGEVKETTGAASSGAFSSALGHDSKDNVYEGKEVEDCGCNDCEDCEEKIDETTTSASSGAYEGPFRKKKKDHVTNKPAWDGGEIVGESYLVNGEFFKKIYEGLNSPNDDSRVPMAEYDMTNDKEVLKQNLKNVINQMNMLLKNTTLNQSEKDKAYEQLKKTGENISKELGIPFNEPKRGGNNLMKKIGSWLGMTESKELNEHHLETREEKIDYILKNGNNKFGDAEMLNHQDGETIDRIYNELEKVQGIVNPDGEQMGEAELNTPKLNTPDLNEKSVSKSQQRFMGMVNAYKKGEMPDASDSIKKAAASMSDKEVHDFASTKHKGLPEKVSEDENEFKEKYSRIFNYSEAIKLANLLDNSPVEEEEAIVKDFANKRKLSLVELKYQIQNFIEQKLAGSESPDYFKMEAIITVINDMLDQASDAKKAENKAELEKNYYKTPAGKAELAANTEQMDESSSIFDGEDMSFELAKLLQKIFPEQYTDLKDYLRFADMTAKTFFGGNYSKAIQHVRKKMNSLIPTKNEGIISGDRETMSMGSNNPTTMAATMKDVSGSMGIGESETPDLKSHGRADDVTFDNENSLKDFGVSKGGFGGFNDARDEQPNYKNPKAYGAPRNKDLGKYDKMTEGKEQMCENCGSPLDEDGHCRRDEVPVAGKIAGEKGSCKKKAKKNNKADDNKFNVEFRKKKEKERENKIEKSHDEYKKELEKNKKHMKKLKEMVEGTEPLSEDKRPSALVQMDRLHKDNKKNFKADLKDSNTGEVAKAVAKDELTAAKQVEEVPENAYELAEKIEKQKMKDHEFNSLKNEGNSTNDEGDEIPKRNMTDDEADDLMLNRGLGQQDIVYDNKPDERFEERMKKDMGDTIYDQRQEKMKFRADAPMYNKDTQPIADGTEETQFDKNISKFNNPKGIKENHIVAAKYRDDLNKLKFVNFNINEAEEVEAIDEGAGARKLSLEGMGNTYTQGVNENVEMRNMLDSFEFYINGGKITKVAKGKQTLSEGETADKPLMNEEIAKMMKLAGYKPSDHVNTANVKKNRGF